MERRAKIVATIGPSCQDEGQMERLMEAGMDVARLNFSHADHETHTLWISRLRAASRRLGRPLAILQDLQGPKIRVGALAKPVQIEAGEEVVLYPQESAAPSTEGTAMIPVDFPQLFGAVGGGGRILLDDGRLALEVLEAGPSAVQARVLTGGLLTSHKGINLPGVRLDIPAFTEKDAADLALGLSLDVDAVAISFVRSAADVRRVRDEVACASEVDCPLLIAKLERPEALEDLEAILAAADGVMVARGDLGVEMAPEGVPGAQKRIIRTANRAGKLVITATQMLESMIRNPLPTRAEASDVANAVFDGTDALMLSGETAVGEHPLEAVRIMDRIVRQAEADFADWGRGEALELDEHDDSLALARAARELADDRDVAAVAVFTRMGRSAWTMSKVRPGVPILAFTSEEATCRRLALAWGVEPQVIPFVETTEQMLACVEKALRESGRVQPGGQVVLVSGFPVGEMRPPNMALLYTIE